MDRDALAARYRERVALLHGLADGLHEVTREALEGVPHIDRLSFRVKDTDSFATKALEPRYSSPFAEIEDQVAGRVIVFFLADLERVRTRLMTTFGSVEAKKVAPENAKTFDYESDHYVFVVSRHHLPPGWEEFEDMPVTFEMQVRTLFMHAWAEPQHDLGYKGVTPLDRDEERELAWLAASAWGADKVLNEIHQRLR